MERDDELNCGVIIDLGVASEVTQGTGAGSTDQNNQPKNLMGGISDND